MRWVPLVAFFLPACVRPEGAYRAPALATREIARVGCIDFSARARPTKVAAYDVAIGLRVGNRCDHVVPIDFRALKVTGAFAGGNEAMRLDAPRDVLRTVLLDPVSWAEEWIAFAPTSKDGPPRRVCIALRGVNAEEPTAEAELCNR